ncbi:MAG: GH3 auxin-responsive promoter family protein [Gammaproteobacteria bacterium]|nr:GH3 auxin-responsive promoter family protein [Gammaproteobacteria bacterium]MCP4090937.1 GH3 auxin-responsive promoter family protein [Gammaproteobacteria bacterium]
MVNAWRKLAGFSGTPQNTAIDTQQWNWLETCLYRNRNTEYGQKFDFSTINSLQEYQRCVPLTNHEEISPLIERMAAGESDLLFSGIPVAFERTGGSTKGAKLIPYSSASLVDFRAALMPWLANTIEHYGLSYGCAYWSISPATRISESTASGISVGLPDGAYLAEEALAAFCKLSATPFWVATLTDVYQWHLATLYYLIRRCDLTLISVWSPSFFLHLIDALDLYAEALSDLLEQGGKIAHNTLAPDNKALKRLHDYLDTRDNRQLWPQLKLVSCWADASSKHPFQELRTQLPEVAFQAKGLLATEGVVTLPSNTGQPVLAAESGFYEFIDNHGGIHLAHQLEEGNQYEVIMTTAGGLYRYQLGDQVLCRGWLDGMPQLQFIGRNGQASDLVGEKLNESFVSSCLDQVSGFRMLFAQQTDTPHYVLVIDKEHSSDSAEQIDQRLCDNPQYDYARRIGQLGPVKVIKQKHPLALYLEWGAQKGRRLGDIKIPALCLDAACLAYLVRQGR